MKTLTLPASKSITNRVLIITSLIDWVSILKSILKSDDTEYMIKALKEVWIEITEENDDVIVNWWINKIKWNNKTLYIWQSWTCMRFLTWFFVLNQVWNVTLTWEERLLERPLFDLIDAIKQMWIEIESNNNHPPVTLKPWKIKNNKIKMDWTSSSQYFTALLQIAPLLENWLEIEVIWEMVSKPYIDLTINEMNKFWVEVENQDYKKFIVKKQDYKNNNTEVEWDASALSYIANYITLHGWEIQINNIWNTSKQWDYKYLDTIKIFWLEYSSDWKTTILKAPWIKNVDLSKYENYEIDFEDMPDVSMSFMSLTIFLPWKTKITWLKTLNLKECKRIDAMKDELTKIWVYSENDDNSIVIWEIPHPNPLLTGEGVRIDIETYNDHRIAMVFGTLNTYIWNLNILNPNCVNKTYPKFWEDLANL